MMAMPKSKKLFTTTATNVQPPIGPKYLKYSSTPESGYVAKVIIFFTEI